MRCYAGLHRRHILFLHKLCIRFKEDYIDIDFMTSLMNQVKFRKEIKGSILRNKSLNENQFYIFRHCIIVKSKCLDQ